MSPQKAGLTHSGWGQACCVGDYDNDGFDDLFVTYWGRNVLYHNNGDGTFTDVSEKAGVAGSRRPLGRRLLLSRLRPRRPSRSVRRQLRELRPGDARRVPGESAYCRYNEIPVPCGPQGFAAAPTSSTAIAATARLRTSRKRRGSRDPRGPSSMVVRRQQLAAHRLLRHGRGGGRFRQRRLARHLRGLRHRAEPALSQQSRRHVPRDRGSGRVRASTRMAWRCRAWASASATTTATAGSTSCARISPSR